MTKRTLNVDFADKIVELESILKKLPTKWAIYEVVFRGKGLEFEGYREYSPDDDAGMIDWTASAKSKKILVKKYLEERDLNIMFLVDVSDGMIFGSEKKLKCECAAEIIAALSHLIVISGDKVGFCMINKKEMEIFLPEGGMKRFNIISDYLSSATNYGGEPRNLDETLDLLLERLNKSINTVFIVSDFINCGKNFKKSISHFSKKFETIPIIIRDKLDEELPNIDSEITIENPSKPGQKILINPSVAKNNYKKNAKEKKEKLISDFEECGVEVTEIKTNSNIVEELVTFLRMRTKYNKGTSQRPR